MRVLAVASVFVLPAATLDETLKQITALYDVGYFHLSDHDDVRTARVYLTCAAPKCLPSPVEVLDLALEGTGLYAVWVGPPGASWAPVINDGPVVHYCYPLMPPNWAPLPPCIQKPPPPLNIRVVKQSP